MFKHVLLYVAANAVLFFSAHVGMASDVSFTLSDTTASTESYQISRATFLPEYSENLFSGFTLENDYNLKGDCSNTSSLYTKQSCTYPKAVVPSSQCPFLPGYYTDCKCLSKFNKTSCTAPYILGGDKCDGKYEKCVCPPTVNLVYANDRCTQQCEGNCIAKTCDPTPNQTSCTNGTQNCDNGCGGNTRKCCVPCTHKITTKPENSSYTYSSCTDGSGSHQIQTGWTCNGGYHQKGSGCEKDCIANSCSGYGLSSCPAYATCANCSKQTTTCDGGGTYYKKTGCISGYHDSNGNCVKDCVANTCSGYGLSSCPANATCASCAKQTTTCAGGGTVYKKTGCASGYHDSNGNCVKDCVANTCSGYGLSSCPANGNCSSCSKQTTTCAGGGTVYKLESCNSGYEVSGNACIQTKSSVGDILYSDMTTSSSVISGKTAIGVVFDADNNMAVALEYTSKTWSFNAPEINITTMNDCSQSSACSSCDTDGKSNTSKILAFGKANGYTYEAAEYCNNYSPAGTSAGKWFLPSAKEMLKLMENIKTVNATMTDKLQIEGIPTGAYWTSTESDNPGGSNQKVVGVPWFYAYYFKPASCDNFAYYIGKNIEQKVVAIIKFR